MKRFMMIPACWSCLLKMATSCSHAEPSEAIDEYGIRESWLTQSLKSLYDETYFFYMINDKSEADVRGGLSERYESLPLGWTVDFT